MADPMCAVPYYDPFDDDTDYAVVNILMLDENPSPTLSQFPSTEDLNSLNHHDDDFKIECIAEPNDPLDDHFFMHMFDSPTRVDDNNNDGGYRFHEEPNNGQNDIPQLTNSGFTNPVEMSAWPVPPAPYNCTCCQVLREITHTNGLHVTKLEIHGRLGMICHAILENRYGGNQWSNQSSHQMFEESLESVREFLIQYCEERKQCGYTMLQDPLLTFYEALCVGLNDDENLDTDDYFQTSTPISGEYQPEQAEPMNQQSMFGVEEVRQHRSSLAMQRERTGRLTLKDLIGYFHLPIDEAAKRMNLCPTVMKKICRKHGVLRWPYRKIKSIERKLSSKRASLTSNDPEERMRVQAEIGVLEKQLSDIFAKLNH